MGITKLFHAITAEGDVSVVIDDAYLRREDEVGDLARQAQAVIADFQSVTEMGQTLAKGDWTHVIRPKGEKDVMNQNLKDMVEHINETLNDISQVATGVATGASEVTKAASSLSSGAQESAASLEQITASMSEVSGQVKKNAESAGEARDLANLASKAAVEGEEAMQKMTDAMGRITQNSNEIQRVIKVIDDIAFQTHLLALNAAVEAARAGQHGKGFAVVAEEVRNLASRSAKAAHETSELISKSSHEITEGGEVATHTAEVLNTIVEQIKKTTDLVGGIAVACNEQAQGVGQITIGLQQIDAVTQQNTAAAEESASAANEMSSMATNLQNQVDQFKL
jgi:methyl-accepting chemotaxis protein